MKSKTGVFKIFSVILVLSLIVSSTFNINLVRVKAQDVGTFPTPFYEFTFEDSTINDKYVSNTTGLSGNQTATLATGAAIEVNSERGSKVLSLKGGKSDQGYLTLPTDLFSQVTDQFSLSFWVKVGSNTGSYSRIFQASSTKLGTAGWPYNDPEFCMVKGGGAYDSAIKSASIDKCQLSLTTPLCTDQWQYITVSVTKDSYDTYVDGILNPMKDNSGNLTAALTGIFNEISSYPYCALGQSVYTDDALEAFYDDFRFYKEALTAEQVVDIYTKEYGQTLPGEEEKEPTLNFDVLDSLGDMLHGSTGFLYGVSEVNVPSMDLITAIKPKIVVQKAADGKQHPSGDAYRLTSYLKEAGVENLQVYLQDYYLEWPYEYNGIDDYKEKVSQIVTKMTQGKTDEEKAFYSYVLFNEPDNIWYSNSGTKLTTFCNDWLTIYNTVKAIDPNAKVAGPNFAGYNQSAYTTFFTFCKENNCLPEIITWHDLQKDKLTYFNTEYNHIKNLISSCYPSDKQPTLFVNETVNFEDVGAPGPLVNWLSIYEEKNVYASLPYWGLANSLNELAADANKPNGAWWVYKWYADMQGYKVSMTRKNVSTPASSNKGDSLYGLTSVDENNKTISTLFGGHEGTQVIKLNNLNAVDTFKDATSAHVKICRTKYTGHQGFADDTPVIYEGNLSITNGTLEMVLKDCDLLDAYYAVITPAKDTSILQISDYNKNWEKTYEAEDATLLGNAKVTTKTDGSDLARSNRAAVDNMKSKSDGVSYTVEVPKDGTYSLEVYYSVAAPYVNALTLEQDAGGQNRAIGKLVHHKLVVDGEEDNEQILTYKSTVKKGYYNYTAVTLKLTAGQHTIALTHSGEDQTKVASTIQLYAALDKIDLIFIPDGELTATSTIQLEDGVKNSTYHYDNTISAYQGGGYASGAGDITFTVVASEDGLYRTNLLASSGTDSNIGIFKTSTDYASDAKATTSVAIRKVSVAETAVPTSNTWQNIDCGEIYLTAGANAFTIHSSNAIALDQIKFQKDVPTSQEQTLTIEAETAKLFGNAKKESNSNASGGNVVDGIGGGSTDNKMLLTFDVPNTGNYKLSMHYSNNEPAPVMKRQDGSNYVHPYNTDLVERYAQIVVNGAQPETVYFKNTLSWDVINNVVLDVALKAGTNTIEIYNDNSYKFSELVNDYAPKFDKFEVTPSSLSEITAISDKFRLYKAIMATKMYEESDYTKNSYEDLGKAMKEAMSLYAKDSVNKVEADAVIQKIESAIPKLINRSGLKTKIAIAKKYDATETDYTVTSYNALLTAIEEGQLVYDKADATAEEVADSIRTIAEKIEGLTILYKRFDNSKGVVTTSSKNSGTHAEYAWDGDASTHPDLLNDSDNGWNAAAAWTLLELPESILIQKISFAPRSGYASRLTNGTFEASTDGITWNTIHTITKPSDGYNTVEITEPIKYKYLRYNSPKDSYLNIADIQIYMLAIDENDIALVQADAKEIDTKMSAISNMKVSGNFTLPVTVTNHSKVTWSSDNEAIAIGENGYARVTFPSNETVVTLTVRVIHGEKKVKVTYTVTVLAAQGGSYGSTKVTTQPKPSETPGKGPDVVEKVTDINVSKYEETSIKFQWEKVDNANKYVIYRYDYVTKKYIVIAETTKNYFTDSNLTDGTKYKYAIKAYTLVDGEKVYGKKTTILTSTRPETPSMTVKEISQTKTKIKWEAVNGATGYIVYIKTDAGKYKKIATIKKNGVLSYTISGLKNENKYTYAVRSFKTIGGKNYYSNY